MRIQATPSMSASFTTIAANQSATNTVVRLNPNPTGALPRSTYTLSGSVSASNASTVSGNGAV